MRVMRFITLYPELVRSHLAYAAFKRAQSRGLMRFEVVDLREYACDNHGTVDGAPYGGGGGMVMRPDVLAAAVQSCSKNYIITTSPGAEYFSQQAAAELYERLHSQDLCFVCGRFSGIDERFLQTHVQASWSLGDFIASGGELPCLMIAEAICRLTPGLLGDVRNVTEDSYGAHLPAGSLRSPLYTKPRVWRGLEVPQVLLSGDHRAAAQWRLEQAQQRTARVQRLRGCSQNKS